MSPSHAYALILVFVAHFSSFTYGQQCIPLKGSYAEKCGTIGAYNQTYKLPYEMSKDGKETMSYIISMVFEEMENCSVGAMGELLTCSSLVAPSCTEGQVKSTLPCRRVCSEFLKRCVNTSTDMMHFTGYLLGLCTLLPNNTGSSKECLEPPGFEKYYNPNTAGLLESNCSKLIIPWCQDLNYTHTILPTNIQKDMYKWFYDKNMTGDPVVDAQFGNDSYVHYLDSNAKTIPKCARNYKKLICADSFPPCFPGEDLSFYTICDSSCKEIDTLCPQVRNDSHDFWIPECEIMSIANGSSAHGFCKHTSWPDPHTWIHEFADFFGVKPTEKPKTKKVKGGIIAAAVLVTLFVILLIIAGIYLWRNRKLPWRFFGSTAEDLCELVT